MQGDVLNEIKYMTLGGGDLFFALFNFFARKNLKKKQSKKLNFIKYWGEEVFFQSFIHICIPKHMKQADYKIVKIKKRKYEIVGKMITTVTNFMLK